MHTEMRTFIMTLVIAAMAFSTSGCSLVNQIPFLDMGNTSKEDSSASTHNQAQSNKQNDKSNPDKKFGKQIGQSRLTAASGSNRAHNLALACAALNSHVVKPGETFSFNETVGARTPERGYREAGIIVNKQKAKGYGGGVCQVSSALYNAVLNNPNLTIVERFKHSTSVKYTNNDATVSYGSKDLKFRNNYDVPIRIQAQANGGTVQVQVYK